MENQNTVIEKLLDENRVVLQRLKENGAEYYTVEQMKKSFEENKKLTKNA